MGLSSSQARLLNLTARMHQIEYKAAKLEAQKLQMANESTHVYNDYLNALEKTKIQMKTLKQDGSIDYIDATYNKLVDAGYQITFLDPEFAPGMSKFDGYTQISTYQDLKNMSSTGKYVLVNDITVPAGENWEPISNFSGIIDGNGHTINNIIIENSGNDVGFIGSLGDSSAVIRNLGFKNAYVNGCNNASDVAVIIANGGNGGTIENCWIDGATIVNSGCDAGGLVSATGGNSIIRNCWTRGITFNNISNEFGDVCGVTTSGDNFSNCYTTTNNNIFGNIDGLTTISNCNKVTDAALNSLISNGTVGYTSEANEADNHLDDPTWLTNLINEGVIILSKKGMDGKYYETSVSTDTGLQEVSDEVELKKAEAKYEADMKRIDVKDRKFDTDLAALDAERNAVKQEMETLKTVAKDNVERTFRLFS